MLFNGERPINARPNGDPAPAAHHATELPIVRLEIASAQGRAAVHEVSDVGFLVGAVPGCDLRLPGIGLPPVCCLIVRAAVGAWLRRLVPTQPIHVNGEPVASQLLKDGDRIRIGGVEFAFYTGEPPKPKAAQPPDDFMVVTESQEETDRYWDAIIGNGGVESVCGWCKDRWGFSWQITPRRLLDLTTSSDRNKAKRAFEAMMTMVKIDVARIEAAAEAA